MKPLDAEKEPTHTIYFEWTASRPDPTSYKQLAPEFHPMNVQIAIEVPVKYFVAYDENSHQAILSPEGMAYASRAINMAIASIMNKEL